MIIFLYGEDEYRSLRKLAEIKNKFFEKNNPASAGLFDFSEKDWDFSEIMMNISSGGLFSLKKLVIIKNVISAKKDISNEKFEKFLKSEAKNDKSSLILVFWEGVGAKKSSKPFKFIQRISKQQGFEKLEGLKLSNWIEKEFRERSGEKVFASRDAIQKLSIFAGNDLFFLSSEIDKLINYKNQGEVGCEDVERIVKANIDTDIFKTVDALARGDKKTALALLHDHLETGEDPLYLLSMYFYQFRNLVKVKPLAEKNTTQTEIASRLKMHPYVARKSLDQVRNFSWSKLKALYSSLCEIDFVSKTGKVDIELALDKFVAGV